MKFRVNKIDILDEKLRPGLQKKVSKYKPKVVSLKDVPLKERRREARKPLYLIRV